MTIRKKELRLRSKDGTFMGTEDRDRKFEKALAKELRSGAAEDSFAQDAACPDAEILAAYHERLLSIEDLNFWKSHIAGCARCQEILAQLEITDEIPVSAEKEELEKESVVGATGRDARLTSGELMMAAGPAPLGAAASLPAPKRAEVTTLRPQKTPWRWIAPAGAIAAGLLVWVAVQEKSKVNPPPQSLGVQVAANHETAPTSSTPPTSRVASAGTSAPTDEKKKDSSPRLPASPKVDLAPRTFSTPPPRPSAKNEIALAAGPPPPEPPVLTAGAMSTDRLAGQGDAAGVVGMLKQSDEPKPPAPTGTTGANGAVAYAGVARTTKAAPTREVAPPPPATDSEQAAKKGVPATTETVEVAAAASPTETARDMVSSKNMLQEELPKIVAPNGYTMWIVGWSGLIERSEDGGKTWKLQKSGVKANLRAGSAPSENVCWVVGNAGVILRTIDGGKNWTKITSPAENDLGAVDASSELRAVVTEAASKRRYETVDGGLNWTPIPSE